MFVSVSESVWVSVRVCLPVCLCVCVCLSVCLSACVQCSEARCVVQQTNHRVAFSAWVCKAEHVVPVAESLWAAQCESPLVGGKLCGLALLMQCGILFINHRTKALPATHGDCVRMCVCVSICVLSLSLSTSLSTSLNLSLSLSTSLPRPLSLSLSLLVFLSVSGTAAKCKRYSRLGERELGQQQQ